MLPKSDRSPPPDSGDWASQVADTVEHVVGVVRSNTVDRLDKLVRLLVFGLLASTMMMVAFVLVAIAAVRLLDVVLDKGVWLPDVLLGAIFTLLGTLAWSKKSARLPGD